MPVLKGNTEFELVTTKPKPGKEYFVNRFTNEYFKTYAEYIERLEQYRQRIWSCSITNKSNLTYEEALISEKNAMDKVNKLPDSLMPQCLEAIQYQNYSLEELQNRIYEYFNTNYFPDEKVNFKANGIKYAGTILHKVTGVSLSSSQQSQPTTIVVKKPKLNSKNMSDSEESGDESSNTKNSNGTTSTTSTTTTATTTTSSQQQPQPQQQQKLDTMIDKNNIYKIQLSSKESQPLTFDVPVKDIIRRIPAIYKPTVKDTIKFVAKRTKLGFWMVDEAQLQKFNIPEIPVPEHLKEDMETLKRKSMGEDEDESEEEEVRKRRKSIYPMEDLEIDRSKDPQQPPPSRPIASNNFISSPSVYGELLMSWHFLQRFESVLELTPFPLSDFESALTHSSETKLLSEAHMSLLRLVFSLPIYNHGTPKKSFSVKLLTDRNWMSLLKIYFQYESKRLVLELKKKQEKIKELEQQNTKMMFLASEIPNSDDEKDDQKEDNQNNNNGNGNGELIGKQIPSIPSTTTTTTTTASVQEKDEDEDDISLSSDDEDEEEQDSSSEDEDLIKDPKNQITSNNPENIAAVLKRKNYNRLDIDERIYILSYLVLQAISSDKIRKHLQENEEVATEIRQEKRELVLEERKIKKDDQNEGDQSSSSHHQSGHHHQNGELDKIQKKEETLDAKLDKYSTRLECLGRDRDFNKYWYWSQLPGKIYVENGTTGDWSYYSTRLEFDELLKYLDTRGQRERKLINALKPRYDSIATLMDNKTQQQILSTQYNFEVKRSARIKAIYGEKSFISYSNKYR